ncbi:S8 family serine peptidase [bacterium]|nr:S8 family serine peptidase [bacterium]
MALILVGCGGSSSSQLTGFNGQGNSSAAATVFSAARSQAPSSTVKLVLNGAVVPAGANQLLVVVNEDASEDQIASLLNLIAGLGARVVGDAPESFVLQLGFPVGSDLLAAINTLEADPAVDEVTVNQTINADAAAPVDPTPATFNGNFWVDHINARLGWGLFNRNGTSPRIGVVDGGFDFDQNAFAANRIVAVVDSENRPLTARDTDGPIKHGTIVSAFAAGDGGGSTANPTVGVCWNSPLYEVKALGAAQAGFVFDGVLGAETALNQGCRWVTLSLGPDAPTNPTSEQSYYGPEEEFRSGFLNVLDLAARKDAVLCFATGNDGEGNNGQFRPKNDNRFLPANSKSSDQPFRTHALITGATNSNKAVSSFSREGRVLTLVAPGEQVGVGRTLANKELHDGCSYANPLTAGSGAALMNINPDLMAIEARQILIETASATVTQQVGNLRMLDFGTAAMEASRLQGVTRSPELNFTLPAGANESGTIDVTAPANGGPVTLSLDILGDSQSFVTITPSSFAAVPAGETRTFQLALRRPAVNSNRTLSYPLMFWGRSAGTVIKRVPLRVNIPEQS